MQKEVNITRFAGDNFGAWEFRLKSILRENGVLDAVINSEIKDEKIESKAQAILIAGVADSHLEYIKKDTAFLMFQNLVKNFKHKGTRSKLFLRRKLTEIRYDEHTQLKNHFNKLEEIFSTLGDAGSQLTEEEKINYILLSMPISYESIVTALEAMSEVSLDLVKDRLLGEEEKKKGSTNSENIQSAFLCYSCGRGGHKAKGCPDRANVAGSSKQWQNRGRGHWQNPVHGHVHNPGRGQWQSTGRGQWQNTGRGQWQPRGSSHVRGWNGGSWRGAGGAGSSMVARTEEERSDVFVSKRGEVGSNRSEVLWCVDSGCSDHLVNDKRYFSNYINLQTPKIIAAAKSGVVLKAVGMGDIEVKSWVYGRLEYCSIKNVLYVPELRKNLLSVSRIINNGYKVVFSNNKVFVYNEYGNLIMLGYSEGSLYTLTTKVIKNYCNYTNINDYNVINLWHRRYGHLNINDLNLLSKQDLVQGMSDLKNVNISKILCESCMIGKSTRLPFNKTGYRASKPLELVHSDVCGPMDPPTFEGYKYFVTFIDDYTHFTIIYLLKNKSEVLDKFKDYYNYVTKHFDRNLLKLRTDNGKEYVSHEFKNFCSNNGILMQYTVAYNPEMNGVAERMNRTLVDRARTVLLESKLPKELWGEAIYFATYVINRSPTSGRKYTPYEGWEGRKPNVCNLRVFGCVAYNHVPKVMRSKWDAKGQKLRMIGYCRAGYKLWDETENKIIVGRNVIFDEGCEKQEELVVIDMGDKNKIEESNNEESECDIECVNEESEVMIRQESSESEMKDKTNRTIKKPRWMKDYVTDFNDSEEVLFALYTGQMNEDTPTRYEDIELREDREDWMKAVEEEIKVLKESKTWSVVPKPREEKLLIDTKWVFTKKYIGDEIIKKARLVVKGFQQENNFDEIYSPVLRLQTLRILLSIATYRDYHIHQMDVKGAFLYGKIDEVVFLKPPLGITVRENCVLKLNRSLYGLRKSPKYWYECFNETITKFGFKRSENDFCLYMKENLYILLYVDDLLIMGSDEREIDLVKDFLSSQFRMKDMGSNKLTYLGISIEKKDDSLEMDQSKYLKSVLRKYGMSDCRSLDVPMDVNFKMNDELDVDMSYERMCRSLLGSLMYVTVGTRPDLATAVYYLSRYQSKPNEYLWKSIKKVLRYVKGTVNYKLRYMKNKSDLPLIGYADSDWARENDRKSTTGYLFKLLGNTVMWKSKKQTSVALSTTEAELVALCEASVEACWIKKLLLELDIQTRNIVIFEDNQSTIRSVKNPDQKRLKHIDIKYKFIKEKVEEGIIDVKYINTHEQLADVFTKPLVKSCFNKHVCSLGIVDKTDDVEEEY